MIGANPHTPITGEGRPDTSINYLLGNDPKRWRANVPTYQRVKARNVYRGIDVAYYGKAGQFEYDFEVAPGTDPASIRLRFAGARRVAVDHAGDLIIETTAGRLRHHSPFYISTNGGTNWSPDSAGLPNNLTIEDFAVSPVLPAALYAATNWGLYKSTDSGHSWRVSGFSPQYVRLVALDPQSPATL